MATKDKNTRSTRKSRKRPRLKAKEQAVLSVVSLRISDEEKERIDEIMRIGNIKRYSDVMRMAIQMIHLTDRDKHEQPDRFHC